MDNSSAWKEIESKWNEIQELWKDNYDIENERLETRLDSRTNMPKLVFVKKNKRVKTKGFEIHFKSDYNSIKSGEVWSTKEMSPTKIFCDLIHEVGIEKVKLHEFSLVSGRNIVSENNEIDTKTKTAEKKDLIRQLINTFNIDAEIIDMD